MIGVLKRNDRVVRALFVALLCFAQSPTLPANARQAAGGPAGGQTGVIALDGLRERVFVRRDARGIPYIEAASEDDLYFAQGYVTASDRLWQMDLLRRNARGQLSEIFGPITLEEDKRHRIYGFSVVADTLLNRLPAPVRAHLEAYSRGVNSYIDSCDPSTLPPEFGVLKYRPTRWAPSDSLVVGKLMAETLSTSWQWDIMRAGRAGLAPELRQALITNGSRWDVAAAPSDRLERKSVSSTAGGARLHGPPTSLEVLETVSAISETSRRSLSRVGLYAAELAASNNWVVSGRRTASGKPLLANDPHLTPSAPSIWYMTHLSAPGLRVAGVTFPGAPGIIIGHNQDIAWGVTNLGADVQDVYIEQFDKENKRRYKMNGEWRDAEVRKETIQVRKSLMDPTIEAVSFEVTVTSHGPIILERDSTRYALRWVALDPQYSELAAFYSIDRAGNWKEFCAALKDFPGPSQNFVYADVRGHIGYYGAGKIPIRRKGDGSVPYDGSNAEGDWMGFIPFEKLPHAYDPPNGIIVTANNRIVESGYPYYLTSDWGPPYRARRILDLLQSGQKLTPSGFRAIQGDVYSISGADFAHRFVEIARQSSQSGANSGLQETVDLFSNWDGRITPDSRAALILGEIRAAFRRRVLVAALGPARTEQSSGDIGSTFIDFLIAEQPREWLPKEFSSYGELLRACEKDAREALTKRVGADSSKWTWGRGAVARFPHPLGIPILTGQKFIIDPFPQTGSGGILPTVNVGSGVSMRLIADTADWDGVQQGIALGESGDPSSPYWKDQLDDWKSVNTRGFPFSNEAVLRAARTTIQLSPKRR